MEHLYNKRVNAKQYDNQDYIWFMVATLTLAFGWSQGHLHFIDMLIKESISDHHNYKGGLSTCTLNGLELPWMMFLTSDAYSHDYQEYMWFMVGTWTLFNITSTLYRGGDEAWDALLLVTATVQGHHKYGVISIVPDTCKVIID